MQVKAVCYISKCEHVYKSRRFGSLQIWAAEKLQKSQDTGLNSRLKVKVHDSSVRYALNGCGSLGRVREFRELSMNEMKRRCKDEWDKTAPQ